ncbi:MAG: ParB/RepB/Spo0J family partition protein [Candidatus Moranbacteria bacterium]|nr:ParB/RepB/Spo0J family partition protein [Candidatus Moranbacteria bacterium]
MASKKYGLGRGLSSLIPQKNKENNSEEVNEKTFDVSINRENLVQKNDNKKENIQSNDLNQGVKKVPVGNILVNEQQPRLYFNDEKLEELSESIRQHGIIQPLTVIRKGNRYELVAGERRLRASKKAGLTKVPVIVREDDLDDQKKLELALIENIQRHDLNVVEEAKAYVKLAEDFEMSQEEIAKSSGKSRSAVANKIRLMKLPIDVQKGLIEGKISEGHAKVILGIENSEKQRALYDLILTQKMTVRDAEKQLNNTSINGIKVKTHLRKEKLPKIKALENDLSAYFNTKVEFIKKGDGGKVCINYFSQEELDEILEKLKL